MIISAIKVCWDHYRADNVQWPMLLFLVVVHLAALVGIWVFSDCLWQTKLLALLLWPVSGLGITAGAHRLWSHRAYKAALPYRILLMLMNSIANQGPIMEWARYHRLHHKHSETSADPHDASRGFFFAHLGWMLLKKTPEFQKVLETFDSPDLQADPVVMWQLRLGPCFNHLMCFVLPACVAMWGWGEPFLRGLLVAGMLRYCVVLHLTWLVNSAAHMYGHRPYNPKLRAAENVLVSAGALGEGWHNWHHVYPYDYAASELGISRQLNPTKAWIDLFARLGWVTERKRAKWAPEKTRAQ